MPLYAAVARKVEKWKLKYGNIVCYYLSVAMATAVLSIIIQFFSTFSFYSKALRHGIHRETMIYSVYSKSPFGYLLSIIYGSHHFAPFHPPLTCRNERHKILEHEPNISLPLLCCAFFALTRYRYRQDGTENMQNRSNVHFHAFLIHCWGGLGGRRGWIEYMRSIPSLLFFPFAER